MTKQERVGDLQFIKDFLEEMEWEVQLAENMEIPALAATFSPGEDGEETVVCSYIELPKEDAEYTKLLQLYIRIPIEVGELLAGELLVLVNQLNLLTAAGHFIYQPGAGDQPHHLAMRCVLTMPEGKLPDEGVLGELLLYMLHYCQIIEGVLSRRLEGEPMEHLIALMQFEAKQR